MSAAVAVTPNQPNLHYDDAVIHIRGLRLRTFIGFNPEELAKQQDVVIYARVEYRADLACGSDDEANALNYKTITKALIQHVEGGKFRLLEKLTADLLSIILKQPQVSKVQVTVDKPNALRFSDSVGVTLGASRFA